MSIQKVNELYNSFGNGSDKIQSLIDFNRAAMNTFYEMAFSLTDQEKITLMTKYSFDTNIVTNLICSLSNDELKLQAIKGFKIIDGFQLQAIVRTLSNYQMQMDIIKEFSLENYCGDIIAKGNQDTNTKTI